MPGASPGEDGSLGVPVARLALGTFLVLPLSQPVRIQTLTDNGILTCIQI